MIMCVLLCYPVSIHMSQLQPTGRPISSSSLFMCGDFNIRVDTTFSDSVKFLNCLDPCNITQHVHTPTNLQGHILNFVLTPTEHTLVSNVGVGEFILDHILVHAQLDFIGPSAPKSNTVTFWRYHKMNMLTLILLICHKSWQYS